MRVREALSVFTGVTIMGAGHGDVTTDAQGGSSDNPDM